MLQPSITPAGPKKKKDKFNMKAELVNNIMRYCLSNVMLVMCHIDANPK